jgi:hypothetical protein
MGSWAQQSGDHGGGTAKRGDKCRGGARGAGVSCVGCPQEGAQEGRM